MWDFNSMYLHAQGYQAETTNAAINQNLMQINAKNEKYLSKIHATVHSNANQ